MCVCVCVCESMGGCVCVECGKVHVCLYPCMCACVRAFKVKFKG